MADVPVESAAVIDQAVTAVRAMLGELASALEGAPRDGGVGELVRPTVAAALRDMSAVLDVVVTTDRPAVLAHVRSALAAALHGGDVATVGATSGRGRQMTAPARALCVVRDDPGAADRQADRASQARVFGAVCRSRGWQAGPIVHQRPDSVRAWAVTLGRVRSSGCQVVVVDGVDRLADTDSGRMAVLALLRRQEVRLLAVDDGIDTNDEDGYRLVTDMITAPVRRTAPIG